MHVFCLHVCYITFTLVSSVFVVTGITRHMSQSLPELILSHVSIVTWNIIVTCLYRYLKEYCHTSLSFPAIILSHVSIVTSNNIVKFNFYYLFSLCCYFLSLVLNSVARQHLYIFYIQSNLPMRSPLLSSHLH